MQAKGLSGYQLNKVRGLSRFNRRAQVWKKQKATQKKTLQEHRNREAVIAREAQEKAEFQSKLDQAYQQYGGQDSPSGGGGRYDGASSKAEWSRDPTSYSASFAEGGLAGLWPRR